MSFKWNEYFTLIFLNAYQKHPCLWNPYYVKYYDCLAKNEALKNIIKELNIPELTISDCLEQIKMIREKYRQEQIRVIKGFQLGKPYKSPFVWFSVITGMLTKVIDDESKLQRENRTELVETMSSLKDCAMTPYDKYKSISNFSCVQEMRQDYKIKPRKNTKFTKTDHKTIRQNDAKLLQCPSCCWEGTKPDRLDIIAKKTYEQIKLLDIAVPSPESNFGNQLYEEYKAHQYRIADTMYQEKNNNIIPCPGFLSNLSIYTDYPTDILTIHTYYPQGTRNYINQQITPGPIVTSKPRFCTREIPLLNEKLYPKKRTKQIETSVKHTQDNKGIQNTVCISEMEADILRTCYEKVQKVDKAHLALDDKKVVESDSCIKETGSRDVAEIIKQNSAVTLALLQCLEKVIQERTKICSVTSFLSKRCNTNSNSFDMTVCEQIPSKFVNEDIYFDTSALELKSLNCLPCLEKIEKDNTVAVFTKIFLKLVKHALKLNVENAQKSCVGKENAINTFIVINKIKECADEILKICTFVDCLKRQLLNKFYSTSKSKNKCPSKRNSALNSVQTQDRKEDAIDQLPASFVNSKDIEVLYGPSISKIRDNSLSDNSTTYAATMTEKLFVKDKDIIACTENRDIGLNVSLSQISLRESGTQYTPKQLQDTGIVTDYSLEEKISVATQNHKPMLIRVIKSNNSESILKVDKETCVRDAHVLWMANVDKCSKMYQKYIVREYYDELLHPAVFHIEKEMNCI